MHRKTSIVIWIITYFLNDEPLKLAKAKITNLKLRKPPRDKIRDDKHKRVFMTNKIYQFAIKRHFWYS